jgi:RNA 2',3'-cyclic 3'-phosphodiesterase
VSDAVPQTRRLFFALWPDERTRARLAQVARQWSHHPVAAANLHMTLHFLGATTAEQAQCYTKALSGIIFEPFELKMDYLGGYARSRIQWLGTSQAPAALHTLVEKLGVALEACGYRPDKRHFVPHVTLSRKEKNPRFKAGLPALDWPVSEFVLAESVAVDGGVHYRVVGRWPGGAC